jgi:hypothetical protein
MSSLKKAPLFGPHVRVGDVVRCDFTHIDWRCSAYMWKLFIAFLGIYQKYFPHCWCERSPFLLQAQQVAWHKYDFLNLVCILLGALVWALAILVRAAMGKATPSAILISACSSYVAICGYAAFRLAITLTGITLPSESKHLLSGYRANVM